MSIARSYARALFETANESGKSSAQIDQIESELDSFVALLKASKDLNLVLTGPTTSTREKLAVLNAIASRAGYSPYLTNFLTLMARKERLGSAADVLDAFSSVRLESEGGVLGRIVSADPMEAADVESIAQAFTRKLGKKVAFKTAVDPELLAGMKVTVNGVAYDGTLRSQLQRLRDRLVLNTRTAH